VTRWPSAGGGGSKWSPGFMDRAETFAESDLSLSHTNTEAPSGTVQLGAYTTRTKDQYVGPGETITFTFTFDLTYSQTVDLGVYQEAGEKVDEMFVDGESVGTGSDDGGSFDASGFTGDCDVTFEVSLSDVYDNGYTTTGWCQPDGAASGNGIGSWSMQEDVAEWDIMPFQTTEDGGNVTVYAVDADTEERLTGELSDPGDLSEIPNDTNVGFEVVLERTGDNQNPRLDAIYRRRKVT